MGYSSENPSPKTDQKSSKKQHPNYNIQKQPPYAIFFEKQPSYAIFFEKQPPYAIFFEKQLTYAIFFKKQHRYTIFFKKQPCSLVYISKSSLFYVIFLKKKQPRCMSVGRKDFLLGEKQPFFSLKRQLARCALE